MTHDARKPRGLRCAMLATSSTKAIRPPFRFTGMPQRSLASLVLGPVLFGILCLALACVAGERTDRLTDTLTVADTLHQLDTAHPADSIASANADSIAASQIAVSVDTNPTTDTLARQQGAQTKAVQASTESATAPSSTQAGSRMHRHAVRALSPLAESIANGLVFYPVDRLWFTAASRGKRMLVDLGRVDVQIATDSVTRRAFQEAVSRLSPLPLGTTLRLRGPWGMEDTRIKSFDRWNGRIVARLEVSKLLDSLARAEDMLPATAVRVDSVGLALAHSDSAARPDSTKPASPPVVTPPAVPVCTRDTLPTELVARGMAVRDSLTRFIVDSIVPSYERHVEQAKVYSSWIAGCFGIAKLLVVANRRTPDMEFAVERAALVDSTGKVHPLRFQDLRFKAHDPLYVFDADGDGVDDLAARGYGDRSGGLTIMRLDLATRRFLRLASGFAWEQ
jgi:hypothetical protein